MNRKDSWDPEFNAGAQGGPGFRCTNCGQRSDVHKCPVRAKQVAQGIKRSDFVKRIHTRENDVVVNVSGSEHFATKKWVDALLLQVGQDGNYTVAYLTDHQASELADALRDYLASARR